MIERQLREARLAVTIDRKRRTHDVLDRRQARREGIDVERTVPPAIGVPIDGE
jgi:hypothetical protein